MRSTCRLLCGGGSIVLLAALVCAAGPAAGAIASSPNQDVAETALIEWTTDIEWVKWGDALEAAEEAGKRICVLVYADDDPRSRVFGEVFKDPKMVSLVEDLIMVHQIYTAPWLKRDYGETGDVVPRVLFIEPDGELNTDLTSGSKRLPYYYAPRGKKLKQNLRAAGE